MVWCECGHTLRLPIYIFLFAVALDEVIKDVRERLKKIFCANDLVLLGYSRVVGER